MLLKKRGGTQPFKELGYRPFALGEARETSAGTLPYLGIIHVAGINVFWFASTYSVQESVKNAIKIAEQKGYKSIGFPLIGAGSGQRGEDWSLKTMQTAFEKISSSIRVVVVRYAV